MSKAELYAGAAAQVARIVNVFPERRRLTARKPMAMKCRRGKEMGWMRSTPDLGGEVA